MDKNYFFENHQLRMEIIDGILHAHYKKGFKITLEDARFLVTERLKLCEGREYPFIIYDGGVISMDKAARDFLASVQGTQGIKIAAFVENSLFSKMLINFFLTVTKQRIKGKAFDSEEKALEWIRLHEQAI
ncbi:MAG: hypothetical protein V4613_10655 [Bacteroidota bacterium]